VRSLPLGKRSRRSQDPEWGKFDTQRLKNGAHSDSYTAQSIPTQNRPLFPSSSQGLTLTGRSRLRDRNAIHGGLRVTQARKGGIA
jgi:hypothetical protein